MNKKIFINLLLVSVLSTIFLLGCGNSNNTANSSKSETTDLLAEIKERGTLKIGT